jgi:hypothetical protein
MSEENFEKLNRRKRHYRTIDDDAILGLKEYYKIDDHDELLKYVKKNTMKGDYPAEKSVKDSLA